MAGINKKKKSSYRIIIWFVLQFIGLIIAMKFDNIYFTLGMLYPLLTLFITALLPKSFKKQNI